MRVPLQRDLLHLTHDCGGPYPPATAQTFPQEVRGRFADAHPVRRAWLEHVLRRLARRHRPRAAVDWWLTPHPALGHHAPVNLLSPGWLPGDPDSCFLEALLASEGL